MEIVFRSTMPAGDAAAAAGEILIHPRTADLHRRDLAVIVASQGIDGLVHGAAPFGRIVVPSDTTRPTLDDMLAAAFAQRLAEGRPLPPAAAAYAKYAALAREGLQPGDVPLESSMEGIFLALRNGGVADLAQPAAAARFLEDWQRMAQTILDAAEAAKDPFVTNLFGDSPHFARERAFLKKDKHVYGEDVRRGRQWLVQLPGGPPTSAMLVLDQPRSLLWKYWSRHDADAPAGGSYLLLAVNWGKGNWVASTDPVQRQSIKTLAEALQAAEARKDPQPAAADPWFDGAPFGHTLVAAPRGGSRLDDDEIFSIIKKWAKARPVADPTRHVKKVGAIVGGAGLTLIISVLASVLAQHFSRPSQTPAAPAAPPRATSAPAPSGVDFHQRGQTQSRRIHVA
jgi:hypothetical protein